MTDQSENFKLFESDDEEVEANDDFKIRPQYEGAHGQELLEFNSQLSKRFKLDERFAEESEHEIEEIDEEDISVERKKNIRILESVLGHEISSTSDKSLTKKEEIISKLIRYDPDDENVSKFIKTSEASSEKPKKSKKKKEATKQEAEPIPISTERYIEVCPDLKEILNTATSFTFSQNFNLDNEQVEESVENEISTKSSSDGYYQEFEKKTERKMNAQQNLSTKSFTPKSRWENFFVAKDDPRLKEGIEFFQRPKPIEDIRVDWQNKREFVLELFRRRKRSGQRSHSTRVQSVQIKNSFRKNNFKK